MTSAYVPVLVLGANLTATAVLRSLASASIPSYCLSESATPPGFLTMSRFYRPLPGKPSVKPGELGEFLGSCSVERAVLMPCADDWVQAVAALPPAIRQRFRSSISAAEVIETLIDKWRFAEVLERYGIPHPRTTLVHSVQELADMPDDRFAGAFLKPCFSFRFTRKYRVKGFLTNGKEEALNAAGQCFASIPDCLLMLQEFIPGPPTQHFFVDGFIDAAGIVRTIFVRHRLRMYPPSLGNSTLQESVLPDRVEPAIKSIQCLLSALGYRGIFSAEFKLDERDGQYKIIEVNARPWQSLEFATRCGVNVCRLAYQDALGLPVDSINTYGDHRRFVNLLKDASAYRELRHSDHMSFRKWVRSLAGASEALLTWRDPLPAIAMWTKQAMSRQSGSA